MKDHHEGYIDWAEFEHNQARLAANSYGKSGGRKSGFAAGERCSAVSSHACRCGRGLAVAYVTEVRPAAHVTVHDRPNLHLGLNRCLGFGGARVDEAIAAEILRVA